MIKCNRCDMKLWSPSVHLTCANVKQCRVNGNNMQNTRSRRYGGIFKVVFIFCERMIHQIDRLGSLQCDVCYSVLFHYGKQCSHFFVLQLQFRVNRKPIKVCTCFKYWPVTLYQIVLSTLPTFRISTDIINPPKNSCIKYNTGGFIWTFSYDLFVPSAFKL